MSVGAANGGIVTPPMATAPVQHSPNWWRCVKLTSTLNNLPAPITGPGGSSRW
ncbi:MAG TPA: hypothetical protein VGO88_02535 [Mycetocola sp.]|jgi:hypothetical protein|nr:hypothetical protein [Mycetocola sp.]